MDKTQLVKEGHKSKKIDFFRLSEFCKREVCSLSIIDENNNGH